MGPYNFRRGNGDNQTYTLKPINQNDAIFT